MPYGSQAETMEPEDQDTSGGADSARVAEIARDLARIAKTIDDPAIQAQLESYAEELGGEGTDEGEGEELALDAEAPSTPSKPTGDKLAVARLRKAVKL